MDDVVPMVLGGTVRQVVLVGLGDGTKRQVEPVGLGGGTMRQVVHTCLSVP